MNLVPNVAEWQQTPGFEPTDCYCVQTCKKAWPDCAYCSGSGKVGRVPGTVWCHYYPTLPKFRDDPRFNPKVGLDPLCFVKAKIAAGEKIGSRGPVVLESRPDTVILDGWWPGVIAGAVVASTLTLAAVAAVVGLK